MEEYGELWTDKVQLPQGQASCMKTVFVQTYGCQMNERDSEEVLGFWGQDT